MSGTMTVVPWVVLLLLLAGLAVRAGWLAGNAGELARLLDWWAAASFCLLIGSVAIANVWPAALAAAVGLLLLCVFGGRGVRAHDRTAEERVVAAAGGPVRVRRAPAWTVALTAGGGVLGLAAAAYAVVRAWYASLSRVGGQITTDVAAAQQAAAELQRLSMGAVAVAAGGWLLTLAVVLGVWLVQRGRVAAAGTRYAGEWAVWWNELSEQDQVLLVEQAERSRLGWQIGLTARSARLQG